MKRFFTIAAAALMTSAFATSTFAAWGTGGWGVPVGPPVGQSSTPSTNPASAPITTPFNPNGDLGAVPGSYKDPKMQATHSKAWQAQQYAKAKANFDKKQYSPRIAAQNLHTPMNVPMNGGQFQNNSGRNTGYFGHDVLSQKYPTNQPQMPRPSAPSKYPPMQPQYPTGGYGGQSSGTWGGYGGASSNNTGSSGGYGGQSQYGMFAR